MELTAARREKLGKAVRALRREGLIPAELYGHGISNEHLAVNEREFQNVFEETGENTVIHIVMGKEKRPVLVHDVSRDFLTGAVTHIDFYQVRMDEKLKAHVPVEFAGEAPAVKERGGFLNKTLAEIEVEALPGDLPHSFSVNLESLRELNMSIYVKDILVPKGVKVLVDPEAVIATITPPVKEEEKPAVPVDVSEVKVESEEKKAERAAEKTAETEQ